MKTTDTSVDETARIERCDVCVVGAGISGLNALWVASRFLTRDQRIVLVDRRERVGGMWVDTYPYVRLHQPHGMFTAGNIKWTLRQDRSYLATKDEVLDHFRHCLDTIGDRVRVDEFFGWAMESDDESDGMVRVVCRSGDGRRLVVEAKLLIKAFGLGVVPNDPLEVSSTRVRSVSPDYCDVRSAPMRDSDAPVWLIGGGKTAMDTAHVLISQNPGREVNLVAGRGTFFSLRERMFPVGLRRWRGGAPLSAIAAETCRRFDGSNEQEVAAWFRDRFGTYLTPETGNFLLGVLSEAESKTIAAGLNDVIMDYFVDAVDRSDGIDMVLRSGATKAITPGSWLVNCTGYSFRQDRPYEPFVSPSGAVLSLAPRSATMHLPSYTAYFLTQLLFLRKLTQLPLYELDLPALRARSPLALPYTVFSLTQYNLSLISDVVPAKVFLDCGLDLNRWYPLPRRLLQTAEFMRTHRRERAHNRETLDTVRERFGVRCGPLV